VDEIIGHRVDREVIDDAKHFLRCPDCGGWIDIGGLGPGRRARPAAAHTAGDWPP
jgi:hypothetical protein